MSASIGWSSPPKHKKAIKFTYFHHTYSLPNDPDQPIADAFEDIAEQNKWGDKESISGRGSTVHMTSRVRPCLAAWFKRFNVKTLVDVPCGDANWQRLIPGIQNISYKGYDISETAVKKARENNNKQTNMAFGVMDLSSSAPPEKPDLFLMRDVIQHVSLTQGKNMLMNAKKCGARYLAVSTFRRRGKNKDIQPGGFYKNDVHAAPFNLPKSIVECKNNEKGWYSDNELHLVDLSTWSGPDN